AGSCCAASEDRDLVVARLGGLVALSAWQRIDHRRAADAAGPVDEDDVAVQLALVQRARNRRVRLPGSPPGEVRTRPRDDDCEELTVLDPDARDRARRQRPNRRGARPRGPGKEGSRKT